MALTSFIKSTEKNIIPELYQYCQAANTDKLRYLAHKLKGGAASITAQMLSQIAGELEHLCSEPASIPETSEITALIDNIQHEFTEIKTYTANYKEE